MISQDILCDCSRRFFKHTIFTPHIFLHTKPNPKIKILGKSIPGGLTPLNSNYGNGWTCVDVAAEIVKAIQKLFPYAKDEQLRTKMRECLRICLMRNPTGGTCYKDGKTIGLHSE
jgi:hypothetical protein